MKKRIIYTDHALKQMEARGITRAQVQRAILGPDVELPGNNPGTLRLHKRVSGGRELQVIYKPKKSVDLVITACWR